MKTAKKKLTPKQERFIAEYPIDLNATQAALRAGYAKNGVRVTGHRLLTNPNIIEAISKTAHKRAEKLEINARRILLEMLRLATSDMRRCFDEDGNLLPIKELPRDVAACISGFEIVRRHTGEDEPEEYVHKIRTWDKNTALTNLAKHLGLFAPQEINVNIDDERALDREIEDLVTGLFVRGKDRDKGSPQV